MKRLSMAIAITLLGASCAQAADIAAEIRKGAEGPDDSNGGFFEYGISTNYTKHLDGPKSRLTFSAAFAYRYKGLFVEAVHQGVDGLNLGYNIYSGEQWAMDVLLSSPGGTITNEKKPDDPSVADEAEREFLLTTRDSFYNGAGIRLTGYFGNAIFQYRLLSDVHNNKGIISSARLGYSKQIRNWNLHSVVSAVYTSAKTNNYLFGIEPEEATTRYPTYRLGSTFRYAAEVGVTHPITEHIVFRSTARYVLRAEDVANSPLADWKNAGVVNTTFSYVF